LFKHGVLNAYDAIDKAVTIDLPSYGIIPKLYEAAKSKAEKPLCYSAGNVLAKCAQSNQEILLVTGFPVPSPFSTSEKPAVHSDGPVGVAFLSKVLVHDLHLEIMLLTDEGVGRVIRHCLQDSLGRETAEKVPIVELQNNRDVTKECQDILVSYDPGIVLASEKPGRNRVGEYHTATGKSLTAYLSRCDSIFDIAKERGIPTVAVGDLGNDVGMGNIAGEISELIPSESVCNCPCRSGIISTVKCDNLVVGTMCDWGVYGILAYLAIEFRNPSFVPESDQVKNIMKSFASYSGLESYLDLLTDGIPPDYTTSCLETLRGIVQSQV
jgi:hypothetical protein